MIVRKKVNLIWWIVGIFWCLNSGIVIKKVEILIKINKKVGNKLIIEFIFILFCKMV